MSLRTKFGKPICSDRSAFLLGENLLRLQHDGTSPSRLGVWCVGLLWRALHHALGGTENQPVKEETEVARPRVETESPWTRRTTQPMREEPLWFWWVCILGSAFSVRLSFCLSKGFSGCMLVINTRILKSRHYLFYLLCYTLSFTTVERVLLGTCCAVMLWRECSTCCYHSITTWVNSSPTSDRLTTSELSATIKSQVMVPFCCFLTFCE